MRWPALGALFALALLFRLPALLNAGGLHSDAAIVGLQARHLLHGELSWFLWGAGYQGALELVPLAAAFALFGATPLVLMAVPLAGHLLLIGFAFAMLRRRLAPWTAALAALPLVLTPHAIDTVALYPPRQWSLTLLFAALWLADGVADWRRPARALAVAALLLWLSLYDDLYALQLVPAAALFLLACALSGGERLRQLAGLLGGAALGGLLFWLVRRTGADPGDRTGFAAGNAARNWPLLRDTCLPWLLSAKVFVPGKSLWPQPWIAPLPVRALQLCGATSLLAALGVAPFLRAPWPLRRLALLALVQSSASLGGFLFSAAPVDLWSVRYLAPLIYVAPFALAPIAHALRPGRFALLLAPYLASATLGGWLAFGPFVDGPLPVRAARGTAQEERALGDFLRTRGVHAAAAQYWLSYRLTFLFDEDPVVVPLEAGEDRYPPYRRAFAAASRVAYLFHPSEPRARPEQVEPLLRASGGTIERLEVAGFTVLIHERR